MRKCRRCAEYKSLEAFETSSVGRDGRGTRCKACRAEYQREYYERNPKQKALNVARNNKSRPGWKRHRMSEAQYTQMFNRFDGLCWSCKDRPVAVIDHDHSCCPKHSCGQCVRGLLCAQCNTALGLLNESDSTILGLLAYNREKSSGLIVQWENATLAR